MKLLIKISFFACLILLVNIAFASNGQENKKPTQVQENGQQGDKKPAIQKLDLSLTTDVETEEAPATEETQSIDSTEDSSVSKYNFIFYFLYKVKYNENQEDLMF